MGSSSEDSVYSSTTEGMETGVGLHFSSTAALAQHDFLEPADKDHLESRSQDFRIVSILALILFFPVGLPAFLLSRQARQDISTRHFEKSRRRAEIALCLSIISIVLFLGCFVAGLIFSLRAYNYARVV